jgi:hypothetical protein
MKRISTTAVLAAVALGFGAPPTLADDLEGTIESIDRDRSSFTVQGIEFHVTDATDFDDGLKGFDGLQTGQRVEVDFQYRDGRHIATEIERDD